MQKQMPNGHKQIVPLCYWLVRVLPLKTASVFLASLFQTFGEKFLKMHCIRKNLKDAFPELTDDEVDHTAREIAANFGRHIAEMAHADSFRDSGSGPSIEVDSSRCAFFDSGLPAIYVGAHVGSWELAPVAMQRYGRPLTAVYSPDKNTTVNSVINSLRQIIDGRYVAKSEGAKPLMEALEKGSSVALLVDQRVDAGLEVDFFRRPSIFPRLPARLAIKFRCPIIPFNVIRISPESLRVVLFDPILVCESGVNRSEVDVTQEMAHRLQVSISENKTSWFCNTRRWKDREIIPISGEGRVKLGSP